MRASRRRLCATTSARKSASKIIPAKVKEPFSAHARREVFLRLNPHRRHHLRTRRGDRPRRGAKAQKEAIQKPPRRLRTHPTLAPSNTPFELPPPLTRHPPATMT